MGRRRSLLLRLSHRPDFLWTLVVLTSLMRLSSLKAAHAVMDGATYRKSGSASGRIVAVDCLLRIPTCFDGLNVHSTHAKSFGGGLRPSFSALVRWGEPGAPVQFLLGSVRVQTPPQLLYLKNHAVWFS
jgi:hypothetical protein